MNTSDVHVIVYSRQTDDETITATNVQDAILIAKYLSFLYGECKLVSGGKEYAFHRSQGAQEIIKSKAKGHPSKTV